MRWYNGDEVEVFLVHIDIFFSSQVGDLRMGFTICGCPFLGLFCAVQSCLSSTGGQLSSPMSLSSSSISM